MGKVVDALATQYAAIPLQVVPDGPRVLLITSRGTRRWVIPKGWPIRGLKPRQVAEREAFEEAGVVGTMLSKRPIGFYHYAKRLPTRRPLICGVEVYALSVERQLDHWPEKGQRETRWVHPLQAEEMVQEEGLAKIFSVVFAIAGPVAVELLTTPAPSHR